MLNNLDHFIFKSSKWNVLRLQHQQVFAIVTCRFHSDGKFIFSFLRSGIGLRKSCFLAETGWHWHRKDVFFLLNKMNALVYPEGGLPYERTECSLHLWRVKKVFVLPLRVFSLKRSTAGAVAAPFMVLSRKKSESRYLTIIWFLKMLS